MSVPGIYVAAASLAAIGVGLCTFGLATFLRLRWLDRRIRRHVAAPVPEVAPEPTPRRQPRAESQRSKGLHRRLARSPLGAVVQARLVSAGSARRASEFILVQLAIGAVAAVMGWYLAREAGFPTRLLMPVGAGAAGFGAPLLALTSRAGKRVAAFEAQLPQAIDAMAATLQAGSTLPQAMAVLAREMPAPISLEFGRVLKESELGLSLPDSLASLMSRMPSPDLLLFTSAISIQQRVGGDLAQIFRGISHTIRERLRIRREVQVLTAQARYSAYIVALLPVALFVFLWFTNYQYLSGLFQPGVPRLLLGCGIGGIVLGYYSMKKLASVEL